MPDTPSAGLPRLGRDDRDPLEPAAAPWPETPVDGGWPIDSLAAAFGPLNAPEPVPAAAPGDAIPAPEPLPDRLAGGPDTAQRGLRGDAFRAPVRFQDTALEPAPNGAVPVPDADAPALRDDALAPLARFQDTALEPQPAVSLLAPEADAGPFADSAAAPAPAAGTANVTPTGNAYIDGMLVGTRWTGPVTYSFPTATASYAINPSGDGEELSGFGGVTPQMANVMRAIFEGTSNAGVMTYGSFESFTNLGFSETTGSATTLGEADIRIAESSLSDPTAYAYYPGGGSAGGDIWLGSGVSAFDAPLPGSWGYLAAMHEAGHALGLKHPHEIETFSGSTFNALPADRDSLEFTVMSYRSVIGGSTTGGYTNETWGYPQTPMMLDIQALQQLYGADYTMNSGNTTYSWSPTTGQMFIDGAGQGVPGANRVFLTIWDGGGRDTYDLSNYTNNVSVDLNPGQWSVTSEQQRAILQQSFFGGEIRARGTVFNALLFNNDTRSMIEDAIGGVGNDTLIGNAIGNMLVGNAGTDSIAGLAGNDTLIGGAGQDRIDAGLGNDLVWGGDTVSTGSDSADIIYLDGNTATPYDDTIGPLGGAGSPGGGDTLAWNSQMGADTVWGGAGQDVLTILGGNSGYTVARNLTRDGINDWYVYRQAGGGDTLTLYDFEVVCFARGTRIATARGEVAVEALRIGERVVTGGPGAALQPITWMGRRLAEVARHPDRAAVAPVLIRAGALGHGVPFRDLRVSPDHALFLDGHLVPARLLVNGRSIVQELWCPRVEYWHVELPEHALLLSEGALTESYLDDGNRRHFDTGAVASLFPDFASERANGVYDREACRPVLRQGPALDALRARLAGRASPMAGEAGWRGGSALPRRASHHRCRA